MTHLLVVLSLLVSVGARWRQGTLLVAGLALAFLVFPMGIAAQASGSVSEELKALYEADQADRTFDSPPTQEMWDEISARDGERRDRVYEMLHGDKLVSGEDYYHAAMVLQHGEGSEDILIAHILAMAAGVKGDDRGPWLSAAALDRYLLRTRQPQRFGTQAFPPSREDPFQTDTDEPMSQGPYVRWLPDSLRKLFGVRSLEEQEDWLREINRRRFGGDEPGR